MVPGVRHRLEVANNTFGPTGADGNIAADVLFVHDSDRSPNGTSGTLRRARRAVTPTVGRHWR